MIAVYCLFVQMEQSISSLAFKGSISEAIVESKNQRKLFLVYISGIFLFVLPYSSMVLLIWISFRWKEKRQFCVYSLVVGECLVQIMVYYVYH